MLIWFSCGGQREKPAVEQAEPKLDTDYDGRLIATLTADSLNAADSVKLLQLAYQAASFNSQFYALQNALIKSYFYACHEKCEKASCSPGNIIAAAMCYFLEGNADSAGQLCNLFDRSSQEPAPEAVEIAAIISHDAGPRDNSNLYAFYQEKKFKTPVAISFLAIADIDNGGAAKVWAADLQQLDKQGASQPLGYAFAYALAQSGQISKAIRELAYYPPLAKDYPTPSFTEQVMIADSAFSQAIYLPQNLYVRERIDDMLLRSLLDKTLKSTHNPAAKAIAALAEVKNLYSSERDLLSAEQAGSEPAGSEADPSQDILRALAYASSDEMPVAERLKTIKNPIARAAYIKCETDKARLGAGEAPIFDREVDLLREQAFWEGRILLSEALVKALGGAAAFKKMSNFGVLDLSVRNNPPEWLAIYARAGLDEGSQVSLITQIVFNLTQHYPYAIGMYETMQMYNHLCKYY